MKKAKKAGPISPETAADIKASIEGNQVGAPPDNLGKPPGEAKPPEKPKKKPRRVELIRVRHDFDDKELLGIGGTLADKQRVYDHTESELKTIQRQFKTTMSGLKCDIDACVDKIKDGYVMREVEAVVMVRINKKERTATKVFYRKDTGEFIRDEVAINTELELFNVLPDKGDYKKKLDPKLLSSQV